MASPTTRRLTGQPEGPRLRASTQFIRDYERASEPLQRLAERKIRDLRKLAEANPSTWRLQYDRVESTGGDVPVHEVDLGGSDRLLLVDFGDDLVMWRMGGHDTPKRAALRDFPTVGASVDPPSLFLPGKRLWFFPDEEDRGLEIYGPELRNEWAYWLDDEQLEVARSIAEDVEKAVCFSVRTVQLILGGPGTGKTTLLAWLLKKLSIEPGVLIDVRLQAPAPVLQQLQKSTGWDMASLSQVSDHSPDVILVDDPQSLDIVAEIASKHRKSCVVAAFDPLQMTASITDDELKRWEQDHDAEEHWLSAAYRQKEVVGRASQRVARAVAESSPFLAGDKKKRYADEREELTRRANDVSFPNPTGRVKTVVAPKAADWDSYWAEIAKLRQQKKLWTHWTPILAVVDPEAAVPQGWLNRLDGKDTRVVALDSIGEVKGLEYQHALLLLSGPKFRFLERGFEGSGQREYNLFRLIRIPFSRAKDSLVTFVFPEKAA